MTLGLLSTPTERRNRVDTSRMSLLRFLRDEIFSTADLLGQVMGCSSRQGTWKALKRFADEGLISTHDVSFLGLRLRLWGITPHGQAMAFDPTSERPTKAYFEPGRVAIATLQHSLDIQRARLGALAAGWTSWTNGDRLGALGKDLKRPDAVAVRPDGLRFGVEIERTFKSLKRYDAVLLSYLRSFRAQELGAAVWVCPTAEQALRLKAILTSIRSVKYQGSTVPIQPERHHAHLYFIDYAAWPHLSEAHCAWQHEVAGTGPD